MEFVALSRLVWVAPATLGCAVAAVMVVRLVAVWLLNPPAAFSPLGPTAPVVFTTVGVGAAIVVFIVVAAVADRPLRIYRIVAFLALLASFLPTLSVARSSVAGAGWPSAVALMAMHIAAWAVTVPMLMRGTAVSGANRAATEQA